MINKLAKLATHLDEKGLHKEADYLDMIIKTAAQPSQKFKGLEEELDRETSSKKTPPLTLNSPAYNLSVTIYSNYELNTDKISLEPLGSVISQHISRNPGGRDGREFKVGHADISLKKK